MRTAIEKPPSVQPPENSGSDALFRTAAINAQRSQWLGPVLLASPISHAIYAIAALVAVAGLVSFAALGEYTRKARINGWLVPASGMIRVFAQQPGVVAAINVREGLFVTKDEPLVVLSAERRSSALGATQAEITRLLTARREGLQAEISQQEILFKQQESALRRRIEAIRGEMEQFSREISLQSSRTDLSQTSTSRLRETAKVGGASQMEVEKQQEYELEQRGRLRQLERTRAERQREMGTLKSELDDLPIKSKTALANLDRDIRILGQELAESEARREVVILAPQAGTVTAIQAEVGGNATTATNLLSIVPEGSSLEAHLFANSRAVGFIRPGQQVLLRYQAYPYQKFGHANGAIESVSRSALNPSEVPTQLAGMTSLVGSAEPIYRVVVRLERQQVNAYGVAQALQPGMQLESDVLLERRKLWEWVLEPLYTLTGKI